MRTAIILATMVGASVLAAQTARADVGVGISVGEPTGLTVQVESRDHESAVNVAVGRELFDHLHVHADYVWIPGELDVGDDAWIPVYIGVGGFANDHPADLGPHAGARLPVGVELEFRKMPLQLFTELAPSVVLVETDPDMPHEGVYVTGALGIRATF